MKIFPALTVTLLGLALAGPAPADSDEVRHETASKRLAVLEQSLQLARAEAEYFRQQWLALRMRDEALGMSALTGEQRDINDKLVQLLGELFQSEKRNREWASLSAELIDKGRSLSAAVPQDLAQRRAEYEAAVRKARAFANGARENMITLAPDFTSGEIISVNEELLVVVVNFGATQKAEIGMPYRILRDNKVIGRCSLIEVRPYMSAARLESVLEKEQVSPGCRVLLETVKAN